MAPSADPRPIVLCPLDFERRALEKAGLGESCDLQCCGPGGDHIARWADSAEIGSDQPVVLAGLAGSLDSRLPAGEAVVVRCVLDEAGLRRWSPTLTSDERNGDATSAIMSTRAPVTSNLARRWFSENREASLIDLESARFAATATDAGWRWGIVRGISDDFSTTMPERVDEWIQPDGRTSYTSVMRALVCRPALLRVVLDLRTNSNAAMSQVSRLLRGLLSIPMPRDD